MHWKAKNLTLKKHWFELKTHRIHWSELPFYEELSVIKTDHAFKRYAMSYKVKLVEKKDPLIQLEASKSSIKDLFNDLLDETKGFKYQITLKVELKNKKALELNFLQFISIQQRKQW